MNGKRDKLLQTQCLVLDVISVNRNHSIPGTDRHENVVEHSFSIAMLCWRAFDEIKPKLSLAKILKYALIHDFSERGLASDTNTYADPAQRRKKKEREKMELARISKEFEDFSDFVEIVRDYENLTDGEAVFVWTIDKLQAVILGEMDNWRPYESYGIGFAHFCEKSLGFREKCPEQLLGFFDEVQEHAYMTYYDNPRNKETRNSDNKVES